MRRPDRSEPRKDEIKVVTMHASKKLEFPVVALRGVGAMPHADEDEIQGAQLFFQMFLAKRLGKINMMKAYDLSSAAL